MLFTNTNLRTAMAYTNAVGDKVYPIVVDIKKGIKSTEEVSFVSSDINTGVLSVAFIQGNDTYNVEGAEVICSIMRPDTTTLEIPCNIINGNTIEVPLGVNGTSQDGIYSFDFKVFKGGNKVVGTPTMNYSVSLSISNDNAVLEDDRLPVLTMLMTQVTELKDEARESINQANTATEATKVATANAIEATNNVNAVINTANQKMVEVDNAKNEMTTTVTNKVNEVEGRFNALTASQQQSSEVIDARDGEASLKARLDRDIEKAKEIYINVEGSHISTDSSVGYLKDVEILGNTIQDENNLADIRSVGDKLEGQELYKIPILSTNELDSNSSEYQEDKLTILSPVQLEKVGDVRDRIICEDGVWGVEKNVATKVLDGSESGWYGAVIGDYFRCTMQNFNPPSRGANGMCNKLKVNSQWDLEEKGIFIDHNITITLPLTEVNSFEAFKQWLKTNLPIIKYEDATPQFIPLPHDQQVKLRTFANKTNISFGCEIEGTIKAQVPKSLGATVNTHTEQISNLNKELDRVKKLEESTVSTVTTESDFTTVEATSNGYFEDVKLEGKTLVNLYQPKQFHSHSSGWNTIDLKVDLLKTNTKYYYKIFNLPSGFKHVITDRNDVYLCNYTTSSFNTFTTINTFTSTITLHINNQAMEELSLEQLQGLQILILEGDHTQNPPSYFEGLKSVGQSATTSEDGADEIVVSSVNENLLGDEYYNNIPCNNMEISRDKLITLKGNNGLGGLFLNVPPFYNTKLKPNSIMRFHTIFPKNNRTLNGVGLFVYDGVDGSTIVNNPNTRDNAYVEFKVPSHGKVRLSVSGMYQDTSVGSFYIMLTDNTVGVQKDYTPNQSDKKRLLYYNNETQTWEKPILREWDSIEKHADGKYYYHQRSGEKVFNGSEDWENHTISGHINTIRFGIHIADATNGKGISNLFIYKHNDDDDEHFKIGDDVGKLFVYVNKTKLSTQDVQGFKQWLQANNVTVVYQLAQEKVYECTNIDLITYANETNYIVESGAISPKSILKVHNNISNVVKILQEKVSLLENKFIQGLKQVLAGDMYSLAELLYPEDFVEENPENNIMLLPFE